MADFKERKKEDLFIKEKRRGKNFFITSSAKALGRAKTMRILEHARANAEWTKQFLASFSNLRVSMRHVLDTEEEKIEKNKRQPKINRKYIAPEKLEAVPLMSDVVALDDVTVSALFRKYCYAFTEKEEDEREKEMERYIDLVIDYGSNRFDSRDVAVIVMLGAARMVTGKCIIQVI